MNAERQSIPEVSLIETMRLDEGRIVRRDRHLARARTSADALGLQWKQEPVDAALAEAIGTRPGGVWRLRLLVSAGGDPVVECAAFIHDRDRVWRVAVAAEPVSSGDLFLRHKTTHREIYNRARAARPDGDDVLLVNERGEITESTIANVVAEIDGVRVTPPAACGLLPGVFRGALLDAGEIEERVVARVDLVSAKRLWLINSLREWIPAALLGQI